MQTTKSSITEKFEKGVSLLCWAYNEEDSIENYLERANQLLQSTVLDYEIVLVDDGSTDGTFEIAERFQKKCPGLRLYRNERNLNVGESSKRAISLASKEFLFWQTIDWCYDISDLRIHLEHLRDCDIVQGVRFGPVHVEVKLLKPVVALCRLFGMKHMTRRSDNLAKALVSIVNYLVIRGLFRIPLSDFQNVSYYRTSWLQGLELESRSSFANPEGLIKSYWSGMTIQEVPINFVPRRVGIAKGTRLRAIQASLIDIFRFWIKWQFRSGNFRKRGLVRRVKVI